jgi:hypothetical protein
MRKTLIIFLCSLPLFFAQAEKTPAFPGAEGFGRYTLGGRGGDIYHVTSLADDNSTGTFRWAINQQGKRTIVFDVSGTIHLTSALPVTNGYVTIAGQTAPGDGICIADYPFTIRASNVIIRFMRFRLGNIYVAYHEGDGLGGMDQSDIIVDHCSVSWSIDECLSVYGSKNLTVQWCIASQSLRNSGHSKGAHGYGGNWGGSGASYHHNLLCHHDSRTPRLGPRPGTQTDERMDMRNNVIYNWGGNGCYGGEGMNVNIVNNYYKPGTYTKTKSVSLQYRIASIGIRTTSYVESYPSFAPMWHVWGNFYVSGNYMNGFSDVTSDNWTKGIYEQISNSSVDNTFTETTKDTIKLDHPIDFIHTTTHTPQVAYEKVLNYAGACLSRDCVDTLMIHDTKYGVATYTGSISSSMPGIIDSQNDIKPANASSDWSPWPTLYSTTAPTDTDQDGMPDLWETTQGLNPNDASDRNTKNSEGYTMLEVYMNSLVSNIMTACTSDGTVMGSIRDDETATSVVLNQSTLTGTSGSSSPWTFNNGFSILNSNSKTLATGSELGIKYSSGVQFTVTMPSNIIVDSVKFSGYDNYGETDSYLSEVNGTTFDPTDYIYTMKDASGNYTVCSHTVAFNEPLTGSFTFTFGGKQVVISIELYARTITGIANYIFNEQDPDGLTNVINIEGKLIRRDIKRKEATTGLQKGIYIVDRKKIIISE